MKLYNKNILLILFISAAVFSSCYLSPDSGTENGTLSVGIPISILTQKSLPELTPGFEVIIAGGSVENPYAITEDDELVFYYKEITLPDNAFDETSEEYELTLNDVPEGNDLFMIIRYQDKNYEDYGEGFEGTVIYFISDGTFTVESGKTTNLTLTGFIFGEIIFEEPA